MEIPKQQQYSQYLIKMKVVSVLVALVCITEAHKEINADIDGANKWINVENTQSSLQPPRSTCNGKQNDTTGVKFCFKRTDDELDKLNTNAKEDEPDTNSKEDVDEENHNQEQKEDEPEDEADNNSSEDSDQDGCSSAPCQNGGTCLPNPDGFKCTCPNGIEGEYCEYDNAEMKVEKINHELNLFDEDLKEDVKVAARMIAQKFDEKDKKMKLFLRSLLPRVLSCLMFPEGENKMEDILDDIFSHYGQKDASFIKTTLYKVLKMVHEDRVNEKKNTIKTILKITGGIEYYDVILKLTEKIFFALRNNVQIL